MSSQPFDFDPADGATQESDTVTIGAGESLRVRFTARSGLATARLKIVANSVTSYVDIGGEQAWVTGGVIEGDVCSVQALLPVSSGGHVTGILETFS